MARASVRTAPRRSSLPCLHCSQLYLTGPRSSFGSSPGAGEARGGERRSVRVRGTRRSSRSAKPAGQIFPGPLCRYRPRMALRPSGPCCIRFGPRSVAETVSGPPGETCLPPRSLLAGKNNGRMEHRFQDGPITSALCLARVTAKERSRRLRGLGFACSSRLDSTVRRNTPRPTSGAASRSLAQCSL